MERLLTVKANYFAEVLNYEIFIIVTDGSGKPPLMPLSSRITVINLDINFDSLEGRYRIPAVLLYPPKAIRYKRKLRRFLRLLRPDITVSLLKRGKTSLPAISDRSGRIEEHPWESWRLQEAGTGEDEKDRVESLVSKYWM
jgi:hypothetical protein